MGRSDVRAAAVPSFPRAPAKYDQEDMDQFRSSLEKALMDIANSVESVSSGVFDLDDFGVATLVPGIVLGEAMDVAAQTFGSDIVFSATDWDTVAWTSGTITMQDATTTYSIVGGNTGNMANDSLRYIGLDTDISTTVLQVSTDVTDFVGDGRLLLGWAKRTGGGSIGRAAFVPTVGLLGLSEDNLSANIITAAMVQANTITGTHINGTTLSAIFADLGTVTAGTIEANVIVAAESFTAAIATFEGVTINQVLTANKLVQFIGSGSVQVGEGRVLEFLNTIGDIGGTVKSVNLGEVLASGEWAFSGDATFSGQWRHTGTNWGFNSVLGSATQTGYTTFANLTTDRTLDANSTTLAEVADVLGTLVEDLKTKGVISA